MSITPGIVIELFSGGSQRCTVQYEDVSSVNLISTANHIPVAVWLYVGQLRAREICLLAFIRQ